ncbi:MAG TPA: aldo/keto reductase [Gemmatimonadetes bacterium]|nr:aldo/keto reductase [Gemmatimonadota bacterium]
MISRRDWLRITAGAGAALGLNPRVLAALQSQEVIMRAIPSTGERLPVIGLGGANTYSRVARAEDFDQIGGVLNALVDGGATVLDTAAGYGASEDVSGRVAQELGIAERIFWATKVNVAGRGGSPADPADVLTQIERSFERLRIPSIDLIQVHNMGDPPTQLGVLERLQAAGRIRYMGITTTSERQYAALADVMRNEPIDFIGIDYAVDNRTPEEVIFPLAQERRIGVIVYLPFGRSRMWARIGDRPLPEWAAEFDAHTWAQFMLKFVIAHPAVTVATPGTSDPEHMTDNIAGGRGRLPNAQQIERMIELVENLPSA